MFLLENVAFSAFSVDLLHDSSEDGENIVGDKISESIGKFDGELGT